MPISAETQALISAFEKFNDSRDDKPDRQHAVAVEDEDAVTMRHLHGLAKKLVHRTETANQTLDRLYYSILTADIAQVAVDLRVFRILAEEPEKAWTVEELGEKCGADGVMLHRLLRYLAAEGYMLERSAGVYQASRGTFAVANDGVEAGLKANRIEVGLAANVLPEFLRRTSYINPIDHTQTPFHDANEGKAILEVLATQPDRAATMARFMQAQQQGLQTWMTQPSFLVDFTLPPTSDPARPLCVDVGGGSGHQCFDLRKYLPGSLQSHKLVVQDMQVMIAQIDTSRAAVQNITPMAHDFFTPQPPSTRSAKVYYLRTVLHDWPDESATKILAHLVDAMADDSVLIIDESVVPSVGATYHMACKDMVMMVLCAAFERTLEQWQVLVGGVGLKIRDVWAYEPSTDEHLIVCVKR